MDYKQCRFRVTKWLFPITSALGFRTRFNLSIDVQAQLLPLDAGAGTPRIRRMFGRLKVLSTLANKSPRLHAPDDRKQTIAARDHKRLCQSLSQVVEMPELAFNLVRLGGNIACEKGNDSD